jgi:hypothetical protein
MSEFDWTWLSILWWQDFWTLTIDWRWAADHCCTYLVWKFSLGIRKNSQNWADLNNRGIILIRIKIAKEWRFSYWCSEVEREDTKGQPGAPKLPHMQGSGKGSHHFGVLYAALPCFLHEAVSRTWIRDLSVTWQQLYHCTKAPPSEKTQKIYKINIW